MQTFSDGRREIYVHPNVTADDLPIVGEFDVPPVAETEPFTPDNMQNPKLYPGDVIVGVIDETIRYVELIVDKGDGHVIVTPLDVGTPRMIRDNIFSSRLFKADRVHVFEAVGETVEKPDIEFDVSKVRTPEEKRPR